MDVKLFLCNNWQCAQDAVNGAYIQNSHNHGNPANINGFWKNINSQALKFHKV